MKYPEKANWWKLKVILVVAWGCREWGWAVTAWWFSLTHRLTACGFCIKPVPFYSWQLQEHRPPAFKKSTESLCHLSQGAPQSSQVLVPRAFFSGITISSLWSPFIGRTRASQHGGDVPERGDHHGWGSWQRAEGSHSLTVTQLGRGKTGVRSQADWLQNLYG